MTEPATPAAAHTAVTVTTHDLMALLHTAHTYLPGTAIEVPPVLAYVARGLTADDLSEGDSDSGYGIVGDIQSTVHTATSEQVDASDGTLVAMIDKDTLVDSLMTETLPKIATRLTEMAREGWWA